MPSAVSSGPSRVFSALTASRPLFATMMIFAIFLACSGPSTTSLMAAWRTSSLSWILICAISISRPNSMPPSPARSSMPASCARSIGVRRSSPAASMAAPRASARVGGYWVTSDFSVCRFFTTTSTALRPSFTTPRHISLTGSATRFRLRASRVRSLKVCRTKAESRETPVATCISLAAARTLSCGSSTSMKRVSCAERKLSSPLMPIIAADMNVAVHFAESVWDISSASPPSPPPPMLRNWMICTAAAKPIWSRAAKPWAPMFVRTAPMTETPPVRYPVVVCARKAGAAGRIPTRRAMFFQNFFRIFSGGAAWMAMQTSLMTDVRLAT
mmetsp:Transcript_9705/g.28702  ORF Transcript_9705/g.28702 Transcript_9705/m.28702 type:complete len:329 (+) Transcript_9705:218-1204(+)